MSPSGSPRQKRPLETENGKDSKKPNKKKTARSRKSVQRPDPPPVAPESLVKLIKRDHEVLEYFRALQSNLDADVQIWKDRAKKYQKENDQLRRKIERFEKQQKKVPVPPAKKSSQRKKTNENGDNRERKKSRAVDKDDESQSKPSVDNGDGDGDDDGVSIQDFMFELDSDSESHEQEKESNNSQNENKKSISSEGREGVADRIQKAKDDEGIAIQDSMFELDSASDDDSDEDVGPTAGEAPLKATNGHHSRQQKTGRFRSIDPIKKNERLGLPNKSLDQNAKENFTVHSETSDDDSVEGLLGTEMKNDQSTTEKDEQKVAELHYRSDYRLLRQAYLGLRQLGVALVDETDDGSSTKLGGDDIEEKVGMDNSSHWANEESVGKIELSTEKITTEMNLSTRIVARHDEDVASNISWAIHSLSRFQSNSRELLESYPLFSTKDLSPVTIQNAREEDEDQHPMVKGKELLFWSLMILDTYCCEGMYSDSDWSNLFASRSVEDGNDEVLATRMRIGMRGRKALVERLLQSWSREISESWPVQDRSDFSTTPNMRMEVENQDLPSEGDELVASQSSPALNSKIQGRLCGLVERCVVCQLVTGLYLSRNDHSSAADVVCRYLVSSSPGKEENHEQLSPVLSFLTLESMLTPPTACGWALDSNTNRSIRLKTMLGYCFFGTDSDDPSHDAFWAVDSCLSETKDIWKRRVAGASSNPRIRDLARIEVAAYQRLVNTKAIDGEDFVIPNAPTILEKVQTKNCDNTELATFSTILTSIIEGVNAIATKKLDKPWVFLAQCQAVRGGMIRQLEAFKDSIGKAYSMSVKFDTFLSNESFLWSNSSRPKNVRDAMTLLKGAISLSNGTRASEYVDTIVESMTNDPDSDKNTATILSRLAQTPMVRVINLEDRPDRMRAFHCHALVNDLIIVQAVAAISDANTDRSSSAHRTHDLFGQFAFDGRGRWESAVSRLSSRVGNVELMVAPFWRPNEMKAFDSNAPDDNREVTLTPSETACALSHIASWKGALRTFQFQSSSTQSGPELSSAGYMESLDTLKRLVRLSGFASGAPLLTVNKSLSPSPVIVILEDDAVLVERFRDRLEELLRELPRDFHFCSLGYSRPKSAPIVAFRDHVGIPTNLYYMTGYVLSESGAKYLLDNLPVVGPVDSWVGLKMTANFENSFGYAVGVGQSQPSSIADPISPKDLSTFLKFRAFCAMQPLCMQRVTRGQSWRNRDTDIEFSGNAAPRQSLS